MIQGARHFKFSYVRLFLLLVVFSWYLNCVWSFLLLIIFMKTLKYLSMHTFAKFISGYVFGFKPTYFLQIKLLNQLLWAFFYICKSWFFILGLVAENVQRWSHSKHSFLSWRHSWSLINSWCRGKQKATLLILLKLSPCW